MNHSRKPITLALGAAFALAGGAAQADSLFAVTDLGSGYMVARADDAKPAAPKPAADAKTPAPKAETAAAAAKTAADSTAKKAEHACGEGMCGGDMKAKTK